jgi:hypothetical protein
MEFLQSAQIDERFTDLSVAKKIEIINIGTYIYHNGLKWVYQDKSKEELEQMKKNFEVELISQSSDIEEANRTNVMQKKLFDETLITTKEVCIQNIKSANVEVQKYNDVIIDEKEHYIQRQIVEIKNLNQRINKLEEENSLALSLSGKLDSLLGKGSSIDNSAKGDFGENIVANQIYKWFPTSYVEDRSSETASGDLRWKTPSQGMNKFDCLIEVKNVQTVRPSEIEKFERDIIFNIKKGCCNCALFVSMKTETIPNKGKFFFEMIENIPVLYVSNVLADMESLKFVFDFLICVQPILDCELGCVQENEDKNIIIVNIQKMYQRIISMVQNISTMKINIDSIGSLIQNEQRGAQDLMNCINNLRNELDWLKVINVNAGQTSVKEDILSFMGNFYSKENKLPTMSDLKSRFNPSIFRDELALKKLRTEATSRFISTSKS